MKRWLSIALFFSRIVIHTVDVIGVEVKHVCYVVDNGYEVGGGWATNFFVAFFPLEPDIVRPRVSLQRERFNEFSMSPKGEYWKISAAANSITGAQPESAGSGERGQGPTTGHKYRDPETQASLGVKPMLGSTADGCVASGAGSIQLSLDDAICPGFRSGALAGAISQILSDSLPKPCSS